MDVDNEYGIPEPDRANLRDLQNVLSSLNLFSIDYINICIEERKVVADSVDTDIWNAFNSSAISKNRSSE